MATTNGDMATTNNKTEASASVSRLPAMALPVGSFLAETAVWLMTDRERTLPCYAYLACLSAARLFW